MSSQILNEVNRSNWLQHWKYVWSLKVTFVSEKQSITCIYQSYRTIAPTCTVQTDTHTAEMARWQCKIFYIDRSTISNYNSTHQSKNQSFIIPSDSNMIDQSSSSSIHHLIHQNLIKLHLNSSLMARVIA